MVICRESITSQKVLISRECEEQEGNSVSEGLEIFIGGACWLFFNAEIHFLLEIGFTRIGRT